MPRKRRRPRRRRDTFKALDEFQLLDLLVGWDLGRHWLPGLGLPRGDRRWRHAVDRLRRAAWEAHRETLLRYFTSDPEKWSGGISGLRPHGPGSRPAAWWEFESPEPRRRIGGDGTPTEGSPLAWGVPSRWRRFNPWDPPTFESEAAYLIRHKLLLRGERRALGSYPEVVDFFGHPAAAPEVETQGLRLIH